MVALPNPKVIGHREWASQPVVLDTATSLAHGRKPDPVYSMYAMRARMRTHSTNGTVEDDVTPAEVEAAVRNVFGFSKGANLKRPGGQVDGNEDLFATLLGMGQSEVNRDNAEAAALRSLAANVDSAKAAVLALAQAANTTGMTDAQVTALAAKLAPLLPHTSEAELARALGARLVNG